MGASSRRKVPHIAEITFSAVSYLPHIAILGVVSTASMRPQQHQYRKRLKVGAGTTGAGGCAGVSAILFCAWGVANSRANIHRSNPPNPPDPNRTNRKRNHTASRTAARRNRPDAISTVVNPKNKSNVFLFGDAVSCTAIEYDTNACETTFILKTDGREFENIIVEDSGLKNKISCDSFEDYIDEEGNINSKNCLKMDGAKVFNFTVDNVPNIVEETLTYTKINKEEISNYCFHQANKFMINFLSTKIEVNDRTPINIEKFGNTSCASIPLILTEIKSSTKNNMLIGFGVGMSMGTCIVDLEKTTFNHGVYNDKI